MEQTLAIINLIMAMAKIEGVDPYLALSIAHTESKLNPQAIGSIGEKGLFQIRPEYTDKSLRSKLFDIKTNIKVGLKKLKEAKNGCDKRNNYYGNAWIVCYNVGVAGAQKIKHPTKFEYYKRVMNTYNKITPKIVLESKYARAL